MDNGALYVNQMENKHGTYIKKILILEKIICCCVQDMKDFKAYVLGKFDEASADSEDPDGD